jgi:hypothetical protein
MRTVVVTLAVCLTGGIARADIEYNFNIHASAPLNAFSFSFTAPTFVGDGTTPAFTPFTVTDGTYSWTMTEDEVVGGATGACFEFGTGGASLVSGALCGFFVGGPPDGAFLLQTSTLPTATGTYGFTGSGLFDFAGGPGGQDVRGLTGSLTVSDVPEPTSILLLGSILGAVGWRVRRRAA